MASSTSQAQHREVDAGVLRRARRGDQRAFAMLVRHDGLDQFVRTTRLRDGASWSDPFAADGTSGGRAGTIASTARLVVTIAGDLSREELIDVAASLHAR